jgi:hypothetical protein
MLAVAAGACCSTVTESMVPSSEAAGGPLQSPLPQGEEMAWHCFENRSLDDSSGCGRTRAECARMVAIRRDAFARHGVPFEASSCERFDRPYCYYYRDGDLAYTRWDCAKTRSACERSFVNNEYEVLSECGAVGEGDAAAQGVKGAKGDGR